MRIESKRLDLHSKFIHDYEMEDASLLAHFDYNPFKNKVFEERMHYLHEQPFNRDLLADVLYEINEKWDASHSTFVNIDKLRDQNSVVVIGGQQAGILSGPLYTINKIISIIAFAKQQEEELGVPVLPVFWIAGEDHDYDEVNHIYLPHISDLIKKTIHDDYPERVSVSNRSIQKDQTTNWIRSLFSELKETAYTKDLIISMENHIKKATTFVDFFALFLHDLFKDTGLILIDSGNQNVRQIESSHFEAIIKKQGDISKGVYRSLQAMRIKGYHVTVDVKENDGHLFIEEDGERILLHKDQLVWKK